ncbi:MAG: hypothetical protein HY820_22290 [Acidobacteria bacterium]|nr:hypothetical protein [Acidobacteriota bacterium]
MGATKSLRVLVVTFTVRAGRIRAITGWDADKQSKKEYFAAKGV